MGNQIVHKGTKHINLRLVSVSDAEFILALRMDTSKNKYISSVDPDIRNQIEWIKKYKTRERAGQEYYFVIIDHKGDRLGAVRIYDFRGNSFCWGSWVVKDNAPYYTAIESALCVYEYAFYDLDFKAAHFDVRKENENVLAFHHRFGACIEKEDEYNYYYTLPKEAYEVVRNKYKRFLS